MTAPDKLTEILQLLVRDKSCRVDVTHSAILDWAKSLLPSKPKGIQGFAHQDGFDDCKSQILANIEGMRRP